MTSLLQVQLRSAAVRGSCYEVLLASTCCDYGCLLLVFYRTTKDDEMMTATSPSTSQDLEM